jgi:hypothetical protein
LALATPPGLRGFVWRWYPLILALGWIPLGTEAGAIAGRFAPSLGAQLLPGIYPPWFALRWLNATTLADPATSAVVPAVVLSFVACSLVLLVLVANDFTSGRSFGIFDVPIYLMLAVSSLDMVMDGIPPAYTWLGGGRPTATHRRAPGGSGDPDA